MSNNEKLIEELQLEISKLKNIITNMEDSMVPEYKLFDLRDKVKELKTEREQRAKELFGSLQLNDNLQDKIKNLEEEIKKLNATWPRVYFNSMNPDSSTKGCRVLSVEGKEGSWMNVTIDDEGEEIQAPTDFGLFSTPEGVEIDKLERKHHWDDDDWDDNGPDMIEEGDR